MHKCSTCGKWFYADYDLWRYRIDHKYYCSWSCIQQGRADEQAAKEAKKRARVKND